MNANIDLVTFNYIKKISALKKKVFRFADIVFYGYGYRSILVAEKPNR